MCKFIEAWKGNCRNSSKGAEFCQEHENTICSSCGAQATHECDSTGQFVCGAYLCDGCEHTIAEDGTNGGIGFKTSHHPDGFKAHCKKSAQVYDPWYAHDEMNQHFHGKEWHTTEKEALQKAEEMRVKKIEIREINFPIGNKMPVFILNAEVTVSAYTEVEADTLEKAREISEDREVEIGGINSGISAKEYWVINDADGEAQKNT